MPADACVNKVNPIHLRGTDEDEFSIFDIAQDLRKISTWRVVCRGNPPAIAPLRACRCVSPNCTIATGACGTGVFGSWRDSKNSIAPQRRREDFKESKIAKNIFSGDSGNNPWKHHQSAIPWMLLRVRARGLGGDRCADK